MNTFQAVTRTVIMLGTIAVGIMAWQVYGPPPEKLAPLLNRAVEFANEALGRTALEAEPDALPPPRLTVVDDPSAIPLPAASPLRIDPEVAPASFAEAQIDAPAASNPEDLVAPLRSLGAVNAEVKPWGAAGQVYRCQCRAANPANPTLERHFDAIHSDPRVAVEQVLAELKSFRTMPSSK